VVGASDNPGIRHNILKTLTGFDPQQTLSGLTAFLDGPPVVGASDNPGVRHNILKTLTGFDPQQTLSGLTAFFSIDPRVEATAGLQLANAFGVPSLQTDPLLKRIMLPLLKRIMLPLVSALC
jgi:hypothetical protein